MRILILGNPNIFKRKIYSTLSKFNKLKLELTSRRKIESKIRIDKYKS